MGKDEEVGADLLPLADDGEVPGGVPGPLQGGHHGCSSGGGGGGAGHPDICNNRQLVEGGVLANSDKQIQSGFLLTLTRISSNFDSDFF